MNLGILKKIIFSSFLYFNFIQTGYASEFVKSNLIKNRDNKITWSIFSKDKLSSNSLNFPVSNIFEEYPSQINFLEDNRLPLLVNINEKKKELIIQSDKQFEENDVVYAEGNVLITVKDEERQEKTNISLPYFYDISSEMIENIKAVEGVFEIVAE